MSDRAWRRGATTLALATLLGACAMGGRQSTRVMAPPHSPTQARQQIAMLERDIAQDRSRLGLSARPPGQSGNRAQTADSTKHMLRKVDPSSSRPPPASPSAAEPVNRPSSGSSGRSDSSGVSDRCRHTRAICRAARHICRLSDYIGDDDSRDRCKRARGDCKQAKRVTQC